MQSSSAPTLEKFDFLVFIGRFQPFHHGHLAVIRAALTQADHVVVLCGSAHQPRSVRNPWTVSEREQMIRGALEPSDQSRVFISPLMDIVYNDELWVRNVQATVKGIVTAHHGAVHREPVIGLIGHSKDHTSYYMNLFPQWGSVNVSNYQGLSATPIRHDLFADEGARYLESEACESMLPASTRQWLQAFVESDAYHEVKSEHDFVQKYRSAWDSAPYTPMFVTVDAVVVQSGHVLMVERKARPGKGLYALPGGFVDAHEKLVDACLRELREETRLKVPTPVLKGSIKHSQVFDDPYRSARGRTFTHAYYIELNPSTTLPKVKGGDDAKHAMWVPLAELDPNTIFEDHYFIIQEMTGM